MEILKSIFAILITILIIAAIFYGLWKWIVSLTTKRSKKMKDELLLKSYKGTAKTYQWGMATVGLLFCGGPIGAVYFYFMFKKIHAIYQNELLTRGISFDKIS